jgi:glycerophosphoryl diester phosphodiesterase
MRCGLPANMKNKLFNYSVAVLSFLTACNAPGKLQDNNMPASFDKQGHRGCRGLFPENTIPAMKMALDLGVTTLEMDAVITKDKQVVLSHEPWFGEEITTKPDGTYMGNREERKFNIYWMTYEDVKTFDVGMKPHPRFPRQKKMKAVKPLLADVIDSVKEYMMTRKRPMPYYNIETKSSPDYDGVFQPKPDEFVELLMSVIRSKGIEEYVIIQSFDFRTLQYLHEHYPSIKTAMLIEDYDRRDLDEQLKALGFVPTIYSPAFELVNDKLIKKCHKQDMKVIPWTVNEKEKIAELKKIGVDGIITDYPDLFNQL